MPIPAIVYAPSRSDRLAAGMTLKSYGRICKKCRKWWASEKLSERCPKCGSTRVRKVPFVKQDNGVRVRGRQLKRMARASQTPAPPPSPVRGATIESDRSLDPCTLYHSYDRAGNLLYVGITDHLPGRTKEHAAMQPWWDDVASIHPERFHTRMEALEAEAWDITHENPKYNKARPRPTGEYRPSSATADEIRWEEEERRWAEREAAKPKPTPPPLSSWGGPPEK